MIKKINALSVLLLIVAAAWTGLAQAEVAWQTRNSIKTAEKPLDIQVTADGQRTFILTAGGKLLIYDSDAKLIDTLAIDPAIDLLSADATGARVFLGNSKNSSVDELLIEYVADFDYIGSPFMGKSEAPVVIAVFSDFQ